MSNVLTLTKVDYTNKFDNCRTLTMYVEKNEPINQQMITAIDTALRAAGSTSHSMKIFTHKNTSYGYASTSLIVRIPN
jgi:hypothetical protein